MAELEASLTNIYKMQYNFGWITADQVRQYVANGWLTKEGYQEIMGKPYEETTAPTAPAVN